LISIIKNFYYGIILPFDDYPSTLDEHNSLIVRIIPDYCFCFSTKARVPVKIVVETVRVKECSDWEKLYIKEEDDVTAKLVDMDKSKLMYAEREKNEGDEENEEKKVKNLVQDLNSFMEETLYNKKIALLDTLNPLKLFEKAEKKIEKTSNIHNLEMGQLVNISKEQINPFGNKWLDICIQIKTNSPFRNFKTYSINSFIAKANDDLRQELMAMQLIKRFDDIFKAAGLPLQLRYYQILITSASSGLIEFLPNTNSIDGCKKKFSKDKNWDLNDFYHNFFGYSFEEAQKNFVESLAAYSIVCYVMSIKDR